MKPIQLQDETLLSRVSEKVIIVLLLLLPFIQAIRLFYERTTLTPEYIKMFYVFLFFFVLLIAVLMIGKKSRISLSLEILIIILVTLLSLFLRLADCYLLKTQPISDFRSCYYYAINGTGGAYMTDVHYLGVYAVTMKIFMGLFGQSVSSAQIFNALVTSMIPAVLYITVKYGFDSRRAALVSAILYAVFPSMILYTGILSCENVAMFFLILTIMFLTLAWKSRAKNTKYLQWVFIALAGISCGLLNLYKPIAFMLMAAVCITEIVYFLYKAIKDSIKSKTFMVKKVITPIIVILSLFGFNTLITAIGTNLLYHHTGLQPQNSTSYMASAFEGLYSLGKGSYKIEVKELVGNVKNEYGNKADNILYQMLIDDIKKDPSSFYHLLENKTYRSWSSEKEYFTWATYDNASVLDLTKTKKYILAASDVYYIYLLLLAAAGLVIRFFRKRKANYTFILISSVIFIIAAAFLLIESQGRYKSVVMPLLCILAGMGLFEIGSLLQTLAGKVWMKLKKPIAKS